MDDTPIGPIGPVDPAAEPGRAGTERDTSVTFLDYFRSVLIRKAVGLDPTQLSATIGSSTLTIGGLAKHVAFVDSPAELLAQFRTSATRSDAALAAIDDLDALAAKQSHDEPTNLRWILVHMIEEYARHCGQADLIRESIDGEAGDRIVAEFSRRPDGVRSLCRGRPGNPTDM